jgi:RND family efflux transporter MFP subunit
LQSPGPIALERTKPRGAEPSPDAVERSALRGTAPAPVNTTGAAVEGRSPIADPIERVAFDPTSSLKRAPPKRPGRIARFFRETLKTAATMLIVVLAVLAALVIWDFYVTAPWTRDGRVRVQVASIAPQVSGQITEIRVVDNQYVHQGDVLYVIDPFDFRVTLDTAKAQLRQAAADLQVKRVQAERRQHLSDLATTPEEQQLFVGNAVQAQAVFDAAQQQVARADINLKRTQVRSPVNGYVTNLLLRVGDFATTGATNISVIDADSYWIDGYFEETKMARVCIGDRAEAALMGYRDPIVGRVQTVTRGISVSNAAPSTQGLPSVDPVYTWVRLAQRVPVRIQITDVPAGVPLVSGMTATVTIRGDEARDSGGWLGDGFPRDRVLDDLFASLANRLRNIVYGPQPSPGCVPRIGDENGATVILPTPKPLAPLDPEQLNPGLAPGVDESPEVQIPSHSGHGIPK